MDMFNLFDFLAMIRVEAKASMLKGQLIFIIKYLVSFQFLQGYFPSVFPYLLGCGHQSFTYTPSLEKESLIYIK